jgi:hypothetical protein
MAPFIPDAKRGKSTTTNPSSQQHSDAAAKRSNTTTNVSSGNAEEGIDRISTLPDTILGCILTLLSVTEAARMTEISKIWWRVFSSPNYKLDCINDSDVWRGQRRPRDNMFHKQSEWRRGVITSLLDTRYRSIRCFIIRWTRTSADVMSRWLYMLSQSGVIEELVLDMPLPSPVGLSHSLLNCTSLCSLTLSNCCWPQYNVPSIYSSEWTLPHVTELTLRHMDMTLEDIKDLLMRCPMLLSLSIGYIRRIGTLDIKCKNLLSITNVGGDWCYKLRIVDAPKLERMLWWPMPPLLTLDKTLIAQAPSLLTLGIFHHCPAVQVGHGVMLEHVKTIALFLGMDHLQELDQFITTLRHSPHLETLHLWVS